MKRKHFKHIKFEKQPKSPYLIYLKAHLKYLQFTIYKHLLYITLQIRDIFSAQQNSKI